jgi:hypothetical protein
MRGSITELGADVAEGSEWLTAQIEVVAMAKNRIVGCALVFIG